MAGADDWQVVSRGGVVMLGVVGVEMRVVLSVAVRSYCRRFPFSLGSFGFGILFLLENSQQRLFKQ